MTPEKLTPSSSIEIEEEFSSRAVEAFMSNYRDAQQAFLELIDNAIDNRIDGRPLVVRVRASHEELVIHNQGGYGLDIDGLRNFFKWGHSDKISSIGLYGVGGKGAMGFLGRSMEVVCSANGSGTEYKVSDPSWETRQEGETKKFTPEVKKSHTEEGYFRVKVTNLKKEVNAHSLAIKLGDIYRPLLLRGQVKIILNQKEIKPAEIKYVEDDVLIKPSNLLVETRFGESFDVKVGVLEKGQKVKPGIRCYYRGRLIEDEQFFGHPTPALMPQASRLIGEANIDFAPVTPNKSSFIHGSAQWEHVSSRMNEVLKPWIAVLANIKAEESTRIENYERERANKAKRVMEHIFATTGLVVKLDMPGEAKGHRAPGPKVKGITVPTKPSGSSGPKEGQTAPVLDANVSTMKRWGALHKWEIGSMGSDGRRSEIIDVNGQKILKINSEHPLYQVEKQLGELNLELYMAETAILKVSEEACHGQSIEDYSNLVNNLSREVGEVYRARVMQREARKRK